MGVIYLQEEEITVSVALIVYNHEKYLRQAIDSILMQEVNFKYEIVVGEDKSTDNSREILLEYKSRYPDKFVLLFREQNVGGTKNVYDIFMNAKGKYIAILEGDDYWIDSSKLQFQLDFLEKNRGYLGVSHIIEARDLQGSYLASHPSSPKIVGKDASLELFLMGYYFSATATVFRNIFLDKSSDYSIYYKAHKYVGDLTLCMLLLDNGRIKVLNHTMSAYRFRRVDGESNYNSIRNAIEKYSDHIQLLNVLNKYFDYKHNFTWLYVDSSTSVFFNSIKHGKIKDFFNIFKTLPTKSKVVFFYFLPVYFLKKILKKKK
jgi:glycosyltransferase involved in cell wall biosynthesis